MNAPQTPSSAGPSSDHQLASSRAAIELWLAQDRAADRSAAGPAPGLPAGPRETPPRLSALLIGALASFWLRRPAQGPVQTGLVVLEASLSPLARRHPWALVAGAVGLGMALGLARPWRWMLRPALLAGLVTPLVSQLALRCLQPASSGSGVAAERDVPPSTR